MIALEFYDFSLSDDCKEESLIFVDLKARPQKQGPFCGNNIPKQYISKGDQLTVKLIKKSSASNGVYAFGFKGINLAEMTQMKSAFSQFDRIKSKRANRFSNSGPGSPSNKVSVDRIVSQFNNVRSSRPGGLANSSGPKPVMLKSNSLQKSQNLAPARPFESSRVISSGNRLSGSFPAANANLNNMPRFRAMQQPEALQQNSNLQGPNSQLNVIGMSKTSNSPSKVGVVGTKSHGSGKIALVRSKSYTKTFKPSQIMDNSPHRFHQLGVNISPEVRSSVLPSEDPENNQSNNGLITKTYSTVQEIDNERNTLLSSGGFLQSVNTLESSSGLVDNANTAVPSGTLVLGDQLIPANSLLAASLEGLLVTDATLLANLAKNIKEKNLEEANKNSEPYDPIGDFFTNWTVTKIFIFSLAGILLLIIFVAIAKWRCSIWMKRRREKYQIKQTLSIPPPAHPHPHHFPPTNTEKIAIDLPLDNAPELPTYKSIMKNLMIRKITETNQQIDQHEVDETDTITNTEGGNSIDTSKTYLPHEQSTAVSQANLIEPESESQFVDSNGVNPALEREKSRKTFGLSSKASTQLQQLPNMLTPLGETYMQSIQTEHCDSIVSSDSVSDFKTQHTGNTSTHLPKLPSISKLPIHHTIIGSEGKTKSSSVLDSKSKSNNVGNVLGTLTHSKSLGGNQAVVLGLPPQLPIRPASLMTKNESDAALKKFQKDLKMRKKIMKLGAGK